MRAWLLVALLALVVAPLAEAEPASGTLVSKGAMLLPLGTLVDATPSALSVAQTAGLARLHLVAARLHVDEWEQPVSEVAIPGTQYTVGTDTGAGRIVDSKDFLNATADLVDGANNTGTLGVYFDGRQNLTALTQGPTNVSSAQDEIVGARSPGDQGYHPERRTYSQDVIPPHLSWHVQGVVQVRGPWVLQLSGPDIAISSQDKTASYQTGLLDGGGGLPGVTYQWLVVTADQGWIVMESPSDVRFSASSSRATWSGTAEADSLSGALKTPHGELQPSGDRTNLTGQLTTELAPAGDAQGKLMTLLVRGDLRSSTLAATSAPSPLSGGWAQAGALTGGTILLVALAVGGTALARRVSHRPLTVDQLLELADRAAEDGNFAVARDWTAKAKARMPKHPRVLIDHGFFCAQCGEVEEALEAYREAAEASDSGEPEFLASQLLLRHFEREDEAAALLLRALEKAPELLFETEEMPEFVRLRGREDVRLGLGRAARRARP